jgi:hypothetical protein
VATLAATHHAGEQSFKGDDLDKLIGRPKAKNVEMLGARLLPQSDRKAGIRSVGEHQAAAGGAISQGRGFVAKQHVDHTGWASKEMGQAISQNWWHPDQTCRVGTAAQLLTDHLRLCFNIASVRKRRLAEQSDHCRH